MRKYPRDAIEPLSVWMVVHKWKSLVSASSADEPLLCATRRAAERFLLPRTKKDYSAHDPDGWACVEVRVGPRDQRKADALHGYLVGTPKRLARWSRCRGAHDDALWLDYLEGSGWPLCLLKTRKEAQRWAGCRDGNLTDLLEEAESPEEAAKIERDWKADPPRVIPVTIALVEPMPVRPLPPESILRRTGKGRAVLAMLRCSVRDDGIRDEKAGAELRKRAAAVVAWALDAKETLA